MQLLVSRNGGGDTTRLIRWRIAVDIEGESVAYTDEEHARAAGNFKGVKRRQVIATLICSPFMALILVAAAAADKKAGTTFGIPTFVLVLIAIGPIIGLLLYSLKNWRCPACNGYLGKGFFPAFCPKCGARLNGPGRIIVEGVEEADPTPDGVADPSEPPAESSQTRR